MKVGDMVRSKSNSCYGIIAQVSTVPDTVQVIWQGLSCKTTWESSDDLVAGVENELGIWRGDQ